MPPADTLAWLTNKRKSKVFLQPDGPQGGTDLHLHLRMAVAKVGVKSVS